ncbi:YHS domain-containing (seleno)protein [Kiloniella sp. b19]|uniref:YHS domain-containing (seleno)protein n=1 Tax=Kiloniella sp. GXU_MW_B19 TaxID=3141326 RepID=UPI0031E44F59
MRKLAFASVLGFGLLSSGFAFAGEQYIDNTGFAVSGYDVVSYFDLEDKQAPVGSPQPAPERGSFKYVAEYNGANWAFASEENLKRFKANPAQYVPAYDGHCAYGASLNGKVPANPLLWRIVDGTLYLNITPNVVGFWESDIPGNIDKAEHNWKSLEAVDSPNKAVPDFDSTQAPVQG